MARPSAATRQRRRLSSLDKLPASCDADVLWAYEALRESDLEQQEILDELNRRIGEKGEGPISRSAFSRASVRLARMGQRLAETREIAGVLAEKLDGAGNADLTLLASETIKMVVYEALESAGDVKATGAAAKMMKEFATALSAAERAKQLSVDGRQKLEARVREQASAAVETVAREKGLTAETVDDIKSQILGIPKNKEKADG